MQLVVERARTLLNASGAAIALDDGEDVVWRAACGTGANHLGLRMKIARSLSGLTFRTGTAQCCDDSELDARVDRESCRRVGTRSLIVVPLRHNTKVVGVLLVLSTEIGSFGWRHAQVLELLGALLASAMSNTAEFTAKHALITERTRTVATLRAETRRLAEVVRTQNEISTAGMDLKAVMKLVCERVQKMTGASGATVQLVEGSDLVLSAGSGSAVPHLGLRLRISDSLSGVSFRTGELAVCQDAETDPRVDRDVCRRVGARSLAVVPLFHRESPVGVLTLVSRHPNHFREPDTQTLRLMAGFIASAMGHASEFQSKKELVAQLAHQAAHDSLTGLPNRRLFLDRIGKALSAAGRSGSFVAVLFLDLDRFKVINDALGHETGDRVLRAVAARLRRAVRPTDTIARFGGDEFTVLCEGIRGTQDAVDIAERMVASLTPELTVGKSHMFISASVGIALGDAQVRPATLVRDADAAM